MLNIDKMNLFAISFIWKHHILVFNPLIFSQNTAALIPWQYSVKVLVKKLMTVLLTEEGRC